MDKAHKETDEKLKALEKRIAKEYKQAEEDLTKTLEAYFKRFEKKDERWRAWVANGDKTLEEYKEWRVGQMAIGERWEKQRDLMAERYTQAADIARRAVNDALVDIYRDNYNYATFEVERGSGIDTGFTLMDREAAAQVLKDDKLYHDPGKERTRLINAGLEKRWNKEQIQSVMLQALLQGKSIARITDHLTKTVGEKDRKASIRNCRTMVTGVENAGRVAGYRRAEGMGIEVEKRWVAVLDNRTRHTHRMLDGVAVPVDATFPNGCRFPGDPEGRPEEVYNCRCTLIADMPGYRIDLSTRQVAGGISYEEWQKGKMKPEDIERAEKRAAAIAGSYRTEYRE